MYWRLIGPLNVDEVPFSSAYSGAIVNCSDGVGRAESESDVVSVWSPNSFERPVRLADQAVLAPVLLCREPVHIQPSGVPIDGPPRVICASLPRRYRVVLNVPTQKFLKVTLLFCCTLYRTPRSVSKYQYGTTVPWME